MHDVENEDHHCGEAAVGTKEREVPDGGDDRFVRLILHDKDDVALLAFTLRVEGHEGDHERLHVHEDGVAVEAHLRPTLVPAVLRVNLQGTVPWDSSAIARP